jgi:predicted enzyme related to lactoylglutathione lyase
MKHLSNVVNWVEIPVRDLARAKSFYQTLFELQLAEMNVGNGLRMALFPVEKGGIGAALCEHKDFYHPGREGPLVYLNANPDLQAVLDRVEEAGGRIVIAKRQISEEHGYMAVFEDCEGNRMALQSMH